MRNPALWLLLVCSPVWLFGQSTVKTPYSGFGIGDFQSQGLSRYQAMGGIGFGEAGKYAVNRLNPAASTELWRFTADVTGFYNRTRLTGADNSTLAESGGLQGIGFVFKKAKPLAFNVGLNSYSTVGYDFVDTRELVTPDSTYSYQTRRAGDGGINQAYAGVANRFFKGRLALGLNACYLFGTLNTTWATRMTNNSSTALITKRGLRGVGFQFGALVNDTIKLFKERTVWRIGGVVEYTPFLQSKTLRTLTSPEIIEGQATGNYIDDTLENRTEHGLNLPVRLGVGASLTVPNKYTLALDFALQNWSSFSLRQADEQLGQSWRVALGGEWIPDFSAPKKLLKRTAYRFGGGYEHTYLTIRGQEIAAWNVSAGLGVPFNFRSLSRVNLSATYGGRGTTANNLLQEGTLRVYLGVSFVEPWFNPRKYD